MNFAEMFNVKCCSFKFNTPSLYNSLKVLKFMTIINGLLPFCLGKDGKTIQLRKVAIAVAISHCLFYIVCVIMTMEENTRVRETFFQPGVSSFVEFTYRLTTLSSFTLIFTLSLLLRKHLLKMMQILMKVDEIFQSLSLKPNYQQITNFTIYLFLGLLTFKVIYNTSCVFLFRAAPAPSFPLQVVFNLPYSFMWIYTFIYVTFVYIIKFCLQQVNRVRL